MVSRTACHTEVSARHKNGSGSLVPHALRPHLVPHSKRTGWSVYPKSRCSGESGIWLTVFGLAKSTPFWFTICKLFRRHCTHLLSLNDFLPWMNLPSKLSYSHLPPFNFPVDFLDSRVLLTPLSYLLLQVYHGEGVQLQHLSKKVQASLLKSVHSGLLLKW